MAESGRALQDLTAKKRAFLAAYRKLENITHAAAAQISRQQHYDWLKDEEYTLESSKTLGSGFSLTTIPGCPVSPGADMQGRLTARRVATLSAPGKYGDGRNLWYRIRPDGSSGWVFRYTLRGRAREMGLGPGPDVSLKEARDKAAQARQLLRQGIDPIEARRKAYAARRRVPSFRQCVGEFIAAHEAAWRNRKHCQQWHNTLATYVFPVMGDQPVDAIGTDEVLCALQPIWQAKTETASRVRGRIERVLDWQEPVACERARIRRVGVDTWINCCPSPPTFGLCAIMQR